MIKREFITFTGVDNMPNYWKEYFSMSQIGNTYEILYNDEDPNGKGDTLIMSNTEYEYFTNQPFLKKIKEGDEILSIGYGIGLIIPEVKERGGKLTVLEKYQEVLDLEKNPDPTVEIIMGDVNQIELNPAFENRKFDIIFSDTSEKNNQKEALKKLLKKDGELVFWTHQFVKKCQN